MPTATCRPPSPRASSTFISQDPRLVELLNAVNVDVDVLYPTDTAFETLLSRTPISTRDVKNDPNLAKQLFGANIIVKTTYKEKENGDGAI